MNFQKPKGQEEDISVTSLELESGLSFKWNLFFFPKKSSGKVNNCFTQLFHSTSISVYRAIREFSSLPHVFTR